MHPLASYLARLLIVIAISNPAGALCASESLQTLGPPSYPSAANTATSGNVLSGPYRPRARQPAKYARARGVEGDDEDDRNGHLLRGETTDRLRPRRETSRYRIYFA